MPDLMAQLPTINLISDVLVPATSAVVGVWLATRRFKHERLWQEKYLAYQRVLSSIEAIRYWGDEISSDVHMLPTVGWFDGKSAHDFYAEARREVAKQCAIGTVLLAPAFVQELTEFQQELFRKEHEARDSPTDELDEEFAIGEHAAEVRSLTDEHLPILIKLARSDLGA